MTHPYLKPPDLTRAREHLLWARQLEAAARQLLHPNHSLPTPLTIRQALDLTTALADSLDLLDHLTTYLDQPPSDWNPLTQLQARYEALNRRFQHLLSQLDPTTYTSPYNPRKNPFVHDVKKPDDHTPPS